MLEHDLVSQAQEFAKSDAVAEILRRLEAKYIEDWKATVPVGTDTREHCYRMVLAIDALRQELQIIAQSEKITEWNRKVARNASLR
jgi:predicted DCC family thiol-disulfide oxidoreductase YuxK